MADEDRKKAQRGWAAYFRMSEHRVTESAYFQSHAENFLRTTIPAIVKKAREDAAQPPEFLLRSAVENFRAESRVTPGMGCAMCLEPYWAFDGFCPMSEVEPHKLALPLCGHAVCGADALKLKTAPCPTCRKDNMFGAVAEKPGPNDADLWRLKVALQDPFSEESDIHSLFTKSVQPRWSSEEVAAYLPPALSVRAQALFDGTTLPPAETCALETRMHELHKKRKLLETEEEKAGEQLPVFSRLKQEGLSPMLSKYQSKCGRCGNRHVEVGDVIVKVKGKWMHHACIHG